MNTIPTIFNERPVPYTVVGEGRAPAPSAVSVVLLNRGGRYLRRSAFQELERAGVGRVVSVEGPRESYDVEELAQRFPFVTFMLLQDEATIGEQVNMAVAECATPLVLVLWNDQRPAKGGLGQRSAERILEDGILCSVPLLQNSRFEVLPNLRAPAYYRGGVKAIPFASSRERVASLYPFDWTGVYARERFVRLGGFDPGIRSPFWQLMDFGFRSWLWGESILSHPGLRITYEGEPPTEDATTDADYRAFYLKNLAPSFRGDSAEVPLRRFPLFMFRGGAGPGAAWKDFREARRWAWTNRYRFTSDARRLIELWEAPEP